MIDLDFLERMSVDHSNRSNFFVLGLRNDPVCISPTFESKDKERKSIDRRPKEVKEGERVRSGRSGDKKREEKDRWREKSEKGK